MEFSASVGFTHKDAVNEFVISLQLSSRARIDPGPAQKLYTSLYDIYIIAECTVNKLLMVDRQIVRNM